MTEFNNNPMNTDQRSKVSLVLFIVSILILVMAGGYLVYAQNLIKTAKSTDDNTASKVTQSNEVSNTAEDNATTTNTTDGSATTDKTTRDPNRYYNDKDEYSFTLPSGYEIRPISKIPGFEDETNTSEYGLDTSFNYQYPGSDNPDSNPDIWISVQKISDGKVNKSNLTNSKECTKPQINNLDIIKCAYEDQLLGGESFDIYIYSSDKYLLLTGHDEYTNAINKIINSFEWLK